MWVIILNGHSLVFRVLMWIGSVDCCGRKCRVFIVGGTCVVNFTQAMHDFLDFISVHGLLDIPMASGRYTWSNSIFGSRIDCFLFSTD